MKRLISLLLVIVLVVGLVPTAFADDAATPDVALTLEAPTQKTVTVSGESVTYYEIPVKVKNNTSEKITLNAFECYLKFDATGFTPVELMADDGTLIMSASFGSPVSNWSSKTTEKKNDLVLATGAEGKLAVVFLNVPANGATELFKLNLKPVDGIEKGDYPVRFATREEAAAFQAKASGNQVAYDGGTAGKTVYAASENKLDCSATTTISITDGAAPTLASISVSPMSGVYGTAQTFNLTATSTSGKDITSLVDFTVKDASGNPAAFTIDKGTLSIGSNNAGTYTVTATPKKDACQGDPKTATFEITPATITNPTVTITGFGKGASTDNVQYSFNPNVLTVSGTPAWYLGSPVGGTSHSGTFAAETDYSVSLNFTVNSNYVLAPVDGKITASVAILGETKTVPVTPMYDSDNQLTGYNIVVSAKTEDKTALVCTTTPTVTTVYDTFLKDITEIPGGKVYAVDDANREHEIPGTFTWLESYPDEQKVGEPTDRGGNPYADFYAKFTPTDSDTYAVIERVHVNVLVKTATIDISDINSNSLVEKEFTYNKQNHTVALSVPDSLKKLIDKNAVAIEYTGDATKKDVGDYKVTATIKILDTAHYMFFQQAETGVRELPWSIKQATLTPADKTIGVRYGLPSKALGLEDLGLTDLANEPDVVVTAAVGSGNVIDTAAVNRDAADNFTGITLNLKNTSADDVGKKTDTVTLAITSKNYNVTKILTVTVSVIAKDAKDLTVTGPASFPYGTTEDAIKSALTITGLPTGATPEYRFSSTSSISTADPGSYTLTVSYEDDNNVYTGTYTFGITKLDLKDATIEAANTLTYTGSEQTQNVTVKYNGTPIDASNYTVTSNTATNAGRYTLTVTANNDSTLYIGSKTYEFIILKAVPKTIDFSVTVPQNVTYNGQPHPATVAQANPDLNMGGFTVSYVGIDGTVDAPVNAGEYTVSIKVNGNGNYAAVTVPAGNNWKFTIAKATPTLEIETAANATYTGQPYNEANIKLTSASNVSVDTYLYYSDEDCTVPASPVNAGLYYVKVKFNGNKNYEEVTSAKASFRINNASYDLRITEAKNAEYTGNPYNSANITVSPNLSVTFTYYSDAGCTNVLPTAPTEVGTYYVKANYAGAANYNEATSNAASFEITKVTLPVPPEIKVDGGDKKLSDLEAGMKAAMGGIDGTFEWYDSNGNRLESTTTIEANKEYKWKFYPKDAAHYNPTEGTTTPYVRDDLSWLPGVLGGGSSFSFHDVTRFDYYYDSVKWAADNGIASGTSRFAFSPDAVCTRAQTVTFLWRAAGSPLPRYRVSPFTDVHAYDYYYEAVLWAVEQGITTGLTATTFGPDETVTRGQVATFLYRAASAAKPNTFNPFTDVKPTAYNYGAILWAYDNRITTGTSTTTFSPDAFCTRAQIVTFLYRYYQGR